MSRDTDHPAVKRHLRLIPKPDKRRPPAVVFTPGRTYRNQHMEAVDFLVERVTTKGGLTQLSGRWINRRSKQVLGVTPTTVRIHVLEDWKMLGLVTHPPRFIEDSKLHNLYDPWERDEPNYDDDADPDGDGPIGA